jgi:heterodisulfide reductase subunit B
MNITGKLRVAPFFGCVIPVRYPHLEMAVRKTMAKLGVELIDLQGFACCPDPIYFKAKDKMLWLTLAARNLCVAEEAGMDIITMCSGCTSTLKEASFLLAEDEELRRKINLRLAKIGKRYKGTVKVKHIVVMLRDDLGIDRVAASAKRKLAGIRVGIHYGCHLLKPSQIMHVDDADYPHILEDLVAATGATPVPHGEQLLCCGKGCIHEMIPLQMTRDIFAAMTAAEVDCMGLICPTCFSSFDLGQITIARKMNETYNLPVIYFCQLLGLAQKMSAEEVGLNWHRIKADFIVEKLRAREGAVISNQLESRGTSAAILE